MKRLAIGSLLWVLTATPAPVDAQPKAETAELDRATRLFEQGSKLFLDKRYQEALDALEESYRLYPSPNSLLLIARCERDLGRLEDAARHFTEVSSSADARATAGEKQYRKTAESARSEGADVRRLLGTVRVRVRGAPEGTAVETQYTRELLGADGSAELAHRAGTARVTLRLPDGRRVQQTVTVSARAWSDVEIDVPKRVEGSEPKRSVPAPPALAKVESDRPTASSGWMFPTGIVLSGIGVVGLGSFAYFGAKSRATYDDLEDECGRSCNTDAQRERADGGERDQTIANISLAVGAVTLAAGAVLLIVASQKTSPRTGRSTRVYPLSF